MDVEEGTASCSDEEPLPVVSPEERYRLLTDLLRGVSRSFYLTLRMLPKGLREPMGLAYLLARAADTTADTRLLPPGERLHHLLAFRAQVQGPASMHGLGEISRALINKQSLPDERDLLTALPHAFSMLEGLPGGDRKLVRSVVVTLSRGMEIDLTRFPSEESGQIVAFTDSVELDRYIYYVAGCVGEFWTAITMDHTAPLQRWDRENMSEVAVRFGKALQLTNVLRDVPKDLRIGRCYLPENELIRAGVTPNDLLSPSAGARARPVLVAQLETTLEHYRAAEQYLLSIPRRCLRLRLATLWPILIGLATLAKVARNQSWLDPAQPSKVPRKWIYGMMALSLPCAFSNTISRAWISHLRGEVEKAL